MASERRQNVINRLKRIEGQVKGVQRMIEDGKECSDILDQVAAARTALYNAGILILENHARECILGASESEVSDEAVDALVRVIKKFARS